MNSSISSSESSNAAVNISRLRLIVLISNVFKRGKVWIHRNKSSASELDVYEPEHHHHMEPNMSILKAWAW
jgi:hypothetical protein